MHSKKILKKNRVKWLINKRYPHFDLPTSTYVDIKGDKDFCLEFPQNIKKIEKIVKNANLVARHPFYPFIALEISERKFGKYKQLVYKLKAFRKLLEEANALEHQKLQEEINTIEKDFGGQLTKSRPIRYASHLDSHIYSYYASEILLPAYEKHLQQNNLDKEILAYRSAPKTNATNQHLRSNNITMAKEVFQQILARNCKCVAMAYDLKDFFGTIDHKILKKQWCRVLDLEKLPPDHFNIYKSLTQYCFVDMKDICKSFNFIEKTELRQQNSCGGNCCSCRTPKKLPRVLFKNAKEFRVFRKTCSGKGFQRNPGLDDKGHPYGIPQGVALSSVLSNIYLLDFDIKMKKFLDTNNAVYRRYCDDILIICDIESQDAINSYLSDAINEAGKYLKIHPIDSKDKYSKSQVYDFTSEKIKQLPLQYLGFCFDGKSVEIRSSSLNRYWRKCHNGIIASRFNAIEKLKKMRDKKIPFQKKHTRLFRRKIYVKYSYLGENNFLTYVKRAFNGMDGINDRKINSQLKGHLKKIRNELAYQDEKIRKRIVDLNT